MFRLFLASASPPSLEESYCGLSILFVFLDTPMQSFPWGTYVGVTLLCYDMNVYLKEKNKSYLDKTFFQLTLGATFAFVHQYM